jgi:hypothetical protein
VHDVAGHIKHQSNSSDLAGADDGVSPLSDALGSEASSRKAQGRPVTEKAYDLVVAPERARLDREIQRIDSRLTAVRTHQADGDTWLREHPEAGSQLKALDREFSPLGDMPQVHQELSWLLAPRHEPELRRGLDHVPDLGIDIGL